MDNRFFNGTAAMVVDLDRCTRSDDCVRACAATYDNNPRFLRHGHQYDGFMIANACMHSVHPVSIMCCRTGACHPLRPRRWLGLGVLAALLALSAGWIYLLNIALRQAALWSGFALLALVVFLTAFNTRKKLPFLPLLKASAWMRFHNYAGWFA